MHSKPYVGAVLLLFLMGPALTAQEKKISSGALPPAVRKTMEDNSRGAVLKGYTTEVEHGQRVYEAETTVNGRSRDISVVENGTLMEIEEERPFSTLPEPVQTALKARAAGARIVKVESLTKRGKLVAYEASTLNGRKRGEIQVGAAGEQLRRPE